MLPDSHLENRGESVCCIYKGSTQGRRQRRKSIFNVYAHSDTVTQKSAPTSDRGDLKRSTGSPGASHEKINLATYLATVGKRKESAIVGDLVTLAKATP